MNKKPYGIKKAMRMWANQYDWSTYVKVYEFIACVISVAIWMWLMFKVLFWLFGPL